MNSLKSMLKEGRVLVGVTTQQVTTAWLAKGMRFFETASEVDLIDSGARNIVRQFRELK